MQPIARIDSPEFDRDHPNYIVMHYLVADLKDAIEKHARGAVLDIGCGNKPYASLFEGKATRYVGCDVEQSDKYRVDVICKATALTFDDASFDTVFSTQVLEHVPEPWTMIAEAARVLKPGGTLILSAPFLWELHEEPHDYFRFTKHGLTTLLTRAGLEDVSIVANGGKWAALSQMFLNMANLSSPGGSRFSKLARRVLNRVHATSLINSLGIWVDDRFKHDVLTLNYVVTARKPLATIARLHN